ncbi:hypothetical protein RB195_016631 [Necator americanus]|uniref:MARVEL domain-containing protein n=1 Tax=Necator americanus TaxID=51031 RepID=A0ABR1C2Y1_NECAM
MTRCISIKVASNCMVIFESGVTKFQLILSICSIIYSPTWLPVFINFTFLAFALFSLIMYSFCWKKRNNMFALPILIYETVTIFWIMIWVYASIMAITTGYLWSLEWLGGPQSDRAAISHDIMNDRYVNPNETNPETKKAIKFGSIILIVSIVILVLKIAAWTIARRVFKELRKERILLAENTVYEDIDQSSPTTSRFSNEKKFVFNQPSQELNRMLPTSKSSRSPSPRESYI